LKQTIPKAKGFVAHEVSHNYLDHNLRREERDEAVWNEACDYIINPMLIEAGFELPDGCLNNPSFNGMYEEQVYNILIQQKGKQGKQQQGKQGPQGQQGQGQSKDPGKCGRVKDFPSPSGKGKPTQAERAAQQQQQSIEAQSALAAAKLAGNLPGNIEGFFKEFLKPIIPWKEVLARFIDTAANTDYSWSKPNRRYIPFNLYLPSLKSQELGHIGIFDDTSGSHFSQEQQGKALSEIRGILDSYQNVEATLIFVDHAVQGEPVDLDTDTTVEIPHPRGGGGTCFKPPFAWIEDHDIDLKAAIYITDGECNSFPNIPPTFDTLWLLTAPNPDFDPPFGEVITMNGN